MSVKEKSDKLVELIRKASLPDALRALSGLSDYVKPVNFELESDEDAIVVLTSVRRALDAASENFSKAIQALRDKVARKGN